MKTTDRNKFYTTQDIGKTRRTTPEGFLLCEGVAIGRVGEMLYTADEIGLDGGPGGYVFVTRTAEEAFRPETLASFEGKPVTIYHPPEFVTPDNYERYAVGTVQNVRRGVGDSADLILADLLITKANAIKYVNDRLPQTSSGYDAEYEQVAPGRGIQRNIIGNHVALLDRGRAGPRCSTKDGDPSMKFIDKLKRLFTAVETKDNAAVQEILNEEVENIADPVASLEGRVSTLTKDMDSIKAQISALPEQIATAQATQQTEKQQHTTDAAFAAVFTGDSLKSIASRAEILSPGISIPTGDVLTAEVGTEVMRKALTTAVATTDGAECVNPFLMGRQLADLGGEPLLGVFNGAAELKRAQNNKRTTLPGTKTKDFGKAVTPAEMNAAATKYWQGTRA